MNYTYCVTVYTAQESGSGTDENVYLRLIGNQATIGDYHLNSANYDDMEKGSSNTYTIETKEFLGDIKELYLYVDSYSENDPAWKLDYIEVHSKFEDVIKKWKFPVYSWVGVPNKDPRHPATINDLWINKHGIFKTEKSEEIYDIKNVL